MSTLQFPVEQTLGYSRTMHAPASFIQDLFQYTADIEQTPLDTCDALILWGGTDIYPGLYHQKHVNFSAAPRDGPSHRDNLEWRAIKKAKSMGIPIIGICRGAQMLCAAAGGGLFQHVTGHTGNDHEVTTIEGEKFNSNSYHHQMMDLRGTEHVLLAWSTNHLSRCYVTDGCDEMPGEIKSNKANGIFKEPEIVYFPSLNALAIQGHPEWDKRDSAFVQYCIRKIKEMVKAEVVV